MRQATNRNKIIDNRRKHPIEKVTSIKNNMVSINFRNMCKKYQSTNNIQNIK